MVLTCLLLFWLPLLTTVSGFLDEGDLCLVDDGRNGTCTLIHNCPEAKEMLLAKKLPKVCGFERNTPLVCCTSTVELYSRIGSVAERMCEKYSRSTFNRPAMVSPSEGPGLIQRLPHMAALGYGEDENNIKYLCTGALVSERFVLTAAHCLTSPDDGRVKWVRVGDPDLGADREDPGAQTLAVTSAYTHPDYSPPVYYHDVALLELDRPVATSQFVRPACLHAAGGAASDALLYEAGWGEGRLREAPAHLVARMPCELAWRKGLRLPDGIVDQCLVCAGVQEGQEVCKGYSGAPLQAIGRNEVRIVGVATFAKPCPGGGGAPRGYARVSNYVDWIESVVWSDEASL